MNNRWIKFALTCILALSPLQLAAAGPGSDGGGKIIICQSKKKKAAPELLDLYEGRALYGLKDKKIDGPVDQILTGLRDKLKTSMDQPEFHLFPLIKEVRETMRLVPLDQIKPVDDAGEVIIPKNCKTSQAANYTQEGLLVVQKEIWERLDNKNKAALILHEAIYKLNRAWSATNSRRTRKIVAHLFSDFAFEPVRAGIPAGAQQCVTHNKKNQSLKDEIYFYPSEKGETIAQYLVLNGQMLFSKTTQRIPLALPWKLKSFSCRGKESWCGFTVGSLNSKFEDKSTVGYGQVMIDGKTKISLNDENILSCVPGEK